MLYRLMLPLTGTTAVLERFEQLSPKVLFSVEAVVYNGKVHNHLDKLATVSKGLPTLQKTIVIPYLAEQLTQQDLANIRNG